MASGRGSVQMTDAEVEEFLPANMKVQVATIGPDGTPHLTTLFYVVEAIRYGFLGTSDVSPWLAFGVLVAIAAGLVAWSQYLFASGRRLKP